MKCAVCIKIKEGVPFDAVTIVGGLSVCHHHFGDVSDDNLWRLYRQLNAVGPKVEWKQDDDYDPDDLLWREV